MSLEFLVPQALKRRPVHALGLLPWQNPVKQVHAAFKPSADFTSLPVHTVQIGFLLAAIGQSVTVAAKKPTSVAVKRGYASLAAWTLEPRSLPAIMTVGKIEHYQFLY
jgi:hypothetical protein